MQFEVNALFSLSVGAGALVGWIRYKKTDPAFLPFLLFLTVGFLAEIISILLIKLKYSNAPVYNVYSLLEAMLLLFLFTRWGFFTRVRKLPFVLYFLLPVASLGEWLYRHEHSSFTSFFVIGYSFLVIFLSINQLQVVLFTEPFRLYQNPVFLICLGLVLYFTSTVLIEVFWVYGLNGSGAFRKRVVSIFSYVNLFTNFVFLIATLWIPLKPSYILRSSSVL